MSEFTDLYRLRQSKRWKLKKIKKKASPEEYWRLKAEELAIGEKLDQIIKQEKDDSRIHAEIPLEGRR